VSRSVPSQPDASTATFPNKGFAPTASPGSSPYRFNA
jgi:hypothetical protein